MNLTFGREFNHSLLSSSAIAGINQSSDNTTLPSGLQSPIDDTASTAGAISQSHRARRAERPVPDERAARVLPSGLQNLEVAMIINQSLDNSVLPSGLQRLTFGDNFNQRLDRTTFPSGLASNLTKRHAQLAG